MEQILVALDSIENGVDIAVERAHVMTSQIPYL